MKEHKSKRNKWPMKYLRKRLSKNLVFVVSIVLLFIFFAFALQPPMSATAVPPSQEDATPTEDKFIVVPPYHTPEQVEPEPDEVPAETPTPTEEPVPDTEKQIKATPVTDMDQVLAEDPFQAERSGTGGTDILGLNFSNGTDVLWFSTGNNELPYFDKELGFQDDGAYEQVILGDYNGDGLTDILTYNPGVGDDSLWYATGNTSDPYFDKLEAFTEDGTYDQLITGDYNGDGFTDILAYNPGLGMDALWFGSGSTGDPFFNKYEAFNEDEAYDQMIIGDYNGDGLTDILAYNPGVGMDALWFGSGNTSEPYFDKIEAFNEDEAFDHMITGDYNGDGFTDILAINFGEGIDALWYATGNESGPYFTKEFSFHEDGTYNELIPGEFNNDGKTDILAINFGEDIDALWYATGNESGPYFDKQWGFSEDGTYDEMIAGDYNYDGLTDILALSDGTGTDALWYSTGNTDGSYFDKHWDFNDKGIYDLVIPGYFNHPSVAEVCRKVTEKNSWKNVKIQYILTCKTKTITDVILTLGIVLVGLLTAGAVLKRLQ